ncbi:MAG: pyridoxamine 5'-phosphate oxidase [Deltaproteobacteria bacterium]|nr:MAG: pyridoxamine 5'-phosphate oxidase [Deltaproteobacteria bacterium]
MSARSDIAFTPAVKAAQEARGSREGYARALARRDWGQVLPPALLDYIAARDSFYLASASAKGQPYVQHRGGPPGFLVAVDEQTLAFGDFAGNRQYISVGNFSENPRAMLILVDYPNRRRLKLWARVELDEGESPLLERVRAASGDARIERVVTLHVEAWDLNCPQHITPRFTEAEWSARR